MELNAKTLTRRKLTGRGLFAVIIIFCAVLAMSGCASTAPTEEVPVAVSCVKKNPKDSKPELRSEAQILAMDDYRAVLAYRSELKKRDKYIGELEDTVDVCADAPTVISVPR